MMQLHLPRKMEKKIVYLVLYVDDILIIGTMKNTLHPLKRVEERI